MFQNTMRPAQRSGTRRRGRLLAVSLASAAVALAGPATASAEIVSPPAVVSIGGANGTTISGVKINGVTTTVAVVQPGASITLAATLTLGPGVNPGWYYTAPIAWAGMSYPSGLGCLQGAGVGYTQTGTFGFVAPATAGVYHLAAELGPNFTCADSWHPATPGPTVATIVVASFDSVCDLAQALSSKPWVADGLCDKLDAAERALERGQAKTAGNILGAAISLIDAQDGKAFATEDAELLRDLVGVLLP